MALVAILSLTQLHYSSARYRDIPWLVYWGANETAERVGGAERFHDALYAHGADIQIFVEEGVGHNFTTSMRNQLIDFYVSKVQRLNQPPEAQMAVAQLNGLTLQFDASASTDIDGTIVRYEWIRAIWMGTFTGVG
jgi:hypothetical protein